MPNCQPDADVEKEALSMKDLVKVLIFLTVFLGVLSGAVLLARHLTRRSYITVGED